MGSRVAPDMEKMFARSVEDASRLIKLTEDDHKLFERVDETCDELVLPEFERYVERKFNEKIPEIIKKHRLMGIPIFRKYGGDGARPLVHALALERFENRLAFGSMDRCPEAEAKTVDPVHRRRVELG